MIQQWLNLSGIALDFAGFMLLLREWWLGVFNEARQMQLAEQLDRMRALRNLRPQEPGRPSPFQSLDRLADDHAVRKARAEYKAALASRRSVFLLATALIVAGFVLQLIAAWPA